ncbi:hypothetical protein XA68_14332 [Ophiocordyceps unilateralis]|uniref:SCP domain-containing protein n=1 Tax=Ophiocordyceps unilateralis TaxID=268505 RepID=A0A2A9PAE2_OPHUN|nr:hypothetical protein XA68_14332 [Ophiocordyceps unilateralis]
MRSLYVVALALPLAAALPQFAPGTTVSSGGLSSAQWDVEDTDDNSEHDTRFSGEVKHSSGNDIFYTDQSRKLGDNDDDNNYFYDEDDDFWDDEGTGDPDFVMGNAKDYQLARIDVDAKMKVKGEVQFAPSADESPSPVWTSSTKQVGGVDETVVDEARPPPGAIHYRPEPHSVQGKDEDERLTTASSTAAEPLASPDSGDDKSLDGLSTTGFPTSDAVVSEGDEGVMKPALDSPLLQATEDGAPEWWMLTTPSAVDESRLHRTTASRESEDQAVVTSWTVAGRPQLTATVSLTQETVTVTATATATPVSKVTVGTQTEKDQDESAAMTSTVYWPSYLTSPYPPYLSKERSSDLVFPPTTEPSPLPEAGRIAYEDEENKMMLPPPPSPPEQAAAEKQADDKVEPSSPRPIDTAPVRPSSPKTALPVPASMRQQRNYALNLHNNVRTAHSASNLTWSAEQQDKALRWAQECVFEHPPTDREDVASHGQNIAFQSGSGTGSKLKGMRDSFKHWYYVESGWYDYDTAGLSTDATWTEETGYPQIGHFVNIVRKSFAELGCASHICKALRLDRSGGNSVPDAVFTVCNFGRSKQPKSANDDDVVTPPVSPVPKLEDARWDASQQHGDDDDDDDNNNNNIIINKEE